MSQQEELRKQQQQQQQQPSPNRPPRPSDVRLHGFGSPEGMELTDVVGQQSSLSQSQQQQQQQQQQPSITTQQSLQPAATSSTESSSPSPTNAKTKDSPAPPPSVPATPVSPTAEVVAATVSPQSSSPAEGGEEVTPSKPRKRRLFFTPSPRKTPDRDSSSAAQQQQQPSPAAAFTTPQQSRPPVPSAAAPATGAKAARPPSASGLTRPSPAVNVPSSSSRRRPPMASPPTGLSGLSTTPRSSRHQSSRKSFNPLGRISDIFSPQSPSFSRTSPGLTPIRHGSSSDDVSSASSDSSASSVKEPFTEQVERLNQLLTTPAQQLGELGQTSGFGGGDEEDDDLDSEMNDLESSRRMLAQELSRVDFSFLGEGMPSSPDDDDRDSSAPNSSGKKDSKNAKTPSKDDSGDDWIPLLPSEGSYEPNFSPAQQPSASTATSTPSAVSSSLYKKKSPPKSTRISAGKSKTGGRGIFGRFYSPLKTPPREKKDSKKRPPPSTAASPNIESEKEDSKPSALTSPPRTKNVKTPDRKPASSTEGIKTPDRGTTAGSTYSPFNPFGLGTPSPTTTSVSLNPLEPSALVLLPNPSKVEPLVQSLAVDGSETQVSSLGMSGVSGTGVGAQPLSNDTGNLFQSIASFADRLAEGGSRRQNERSQRLVRVEETEASSRILNELDSILTPPREQQIEESLQQLPAVTPGDQTPYFGRNRRLEETFDSTDDQAVGSSFVDTDSPDVPTDERMETPDQPRIPSLLDTRKSAVPPHRGLKDDLASPASRAFGQDPFVTPPQGRTQLPSLVDAPTTAKKVEGVTIQKEGGNMLSQNLQSEPEGGKQKKASMSWGSLLTFSARKGKEETSTTGIPPASETTDASASVVVAQTQQDEKTAQASAESTQDAPSMDAVGRDVTSGTTLFPMTSSAEISMATYRFPSDEINKSSASTKSGIGSSGVADAIGSSGRPPRPPVLGSFPSLQRYSPDAVEAPTTRTQGSPLDIERGTPSATALPALDTRIDVGEIKVRDDGTQLQTLGPPILAENSDDEMIFDTSTPNAYAGDIDKVDSPPELDESYEDGAEPKTPLSCETEETPGTVPAKSYSTETIEKSKHSDDQEKENECLGFFMKCSMIVFVIGVPLLVGFLIGRTPDGTMGPNPTSAPSLSSIPTSTYSPTPSPSVQPSLFQTVPPSSRSPSFEVSESPTRLGTVSFTTPYEIFIQNGLVSPVSQPEYIPSLLDAMDILTYDILDNIENGGDLNMNNLRRRKLIAVLLPTEIIQITNVTCPVVTGMDLCQNVVAQISLVDAGEKLKLFRATTELAIEIGRLQYHLDAVDPTSPAEVVDSLWELPAPAPFSKPTTPPSASPSSLESASPSHSPSIGLSLEPSSNPTFFPVVATTAPSSTPSSLPTQLDLYQFLVDNSFDGGTALTVPWSPQGKAYAWLVGDTKGQSFSPQRILQRYAMATFYYATFGDTWLSKDFWLSSESECSWYNEVGSRPACNENQELVNLELNLNNLGGSLPAELALLSNSLERVTLQGGPGKFLSGSLPPELGFLTRLKVFFVRGNNISGIIPQELGDWRALEQLDLSRNRLAGPLPTEIGNFRNLVFFEASANSLSGILPTEMGMMTKCEQLLFEDNRLLSSIPTQLGNLSVLRELKGGANVLLSLPSELGRLSSAVTISFQGANIPGRIPSELGQLQQLRFLELRNNVFQGNIPSELGLLVQMRDQLNLSNNRLTGPIPSDLGRLVELRGLKLQRNHLSGQLPSEISQLSKLTSIQLEGNRLSGTIPDPVCTTFNSTYPSFSSDCSDFSDDCPCCTHCCVDGRSCECRYVNTPREFLCFQQKSVDP